MDHAAKALLLAALYCLLAEGASEAFAFGVPVVALAFAIHSALSVRPFPRMRVLGLARLVVVYLLGLLRGGFDVAWRALARRPPLTPDWLEHQLRLSGGAARRLFMMAISVMPGTISVEIEGTSLHLHVLLKANEDELRGQLDALELSVASAFGEVLPAAVSR